MRLRSFLSALTCSAAVLVAAWLPISSSAAIAPPLPGGVALGMTVPQLQQVQPALKRVPHPARLAGGLVGSWSGSAVAVAGLALTPTFYLSDGQLQRVEYLAREGGPAAFAALLAWARASWGVELAATDAESASASWSTDDMDAYLQLASPGPGGPVRLVVKHRVLKDASEL